MIIDRLRHLHRMADLLRTHPVVAILGARQVGKTTLARTFTRELAGPVTRFDLEDPDEVARLAEPKLALAPLEGLVILDEVQRRPELFPVLRVLVDRPDTTTRFLVLGSAGPDLLRQSSETLAGRIAYHELEGLGLDEVGMQAAPRLWLRGGFPRSFLAQTERDSFEWRRGFVRTFLERDLPSLGVQIPAPPLHRFWQMLSTTTARPGTVPSWRGLRRGRDHSTSLPRPAGKRAGRAAAPPVVREHRQAEGQVAEGLHRRHRRTHAPRRYGHAGTRGAPQDRCLVGGVRDQGAGRVPGRTTEELFFWATHAGAELDLLVVRGRRRLGFEIKRTTSPASTRSMQADLATLRLDSLDVIHAGEHTFPLTPQIRAVAFSRMLTDLEPL